MTYELSVGVSTIIHHRRQTNNCITPPSCGAGPFKIRLIPRSTCFGLWIQSKTGDTTTGPWGFELFVPISWTSWGLLLPHHRLSSLLLLSSTTNIEFRQIAHLLLYLLTTTINKRQQTRHYPCWQDEQVWSIEYVERSMYSCGCTANRCWVDK